MEKRLTTIRLSHWGLSRLEFDKWIFKTNARVGCIIHDTMGDSEEEYYFSSEEDFMAFKLTFKEKDGILGYKGFVNAGTSSYYCPYLPTRK